MERLDTVRLEVAAAGARGGPLPISGKRSFAIVAFLGRSTRLALGCVLLLHAPAAMSAPSGRDVILGMLAARARGDDATTVFRLETLDAAGNAQNQVVLSQRKQCDDALRHLLFVREPANMVGTGFLTWAHADRLPDMWLYLPELGRVRRMNARTVGASFMGTDFTHEDLGAVPVDARTHRLFGEESIDGEASYKVISVPRAPEPYAKIVSG